MPGIPSLRPKRHPAGAPARQCWCGGRSRAKRPMQITLCRFAMVGLAEGVTRKENTVIAPERGTEGEREAPAGGGKSWSQLTALEKIEDGRARLTTGEEFGHSREMVARFIRAGRGLRAAKRNCGGPPSPGGAATLPAAFRGLGQRTGTRDPSRHAPVRLRQRTVSCRRRRYRDCRGYRGCTGWPRLPHGWRRTPARNRNPASVEHNGHELVSQRPYAMALGYEDLSDHGELRDAAPLALLVGKRDVTGDKRIRERHRGYALASARTLDRREPGDPEAAAEALADWRAQHDHSPAAVAAVIAGLSLCRDLQRGAFEPAKTPRVGGVRIARGLAHWHSS